MTPTGLIIEAPKTSPGHFGPAIASRIRTGFEAPRLPDELYFELHNGDEHYLSQLSDPFLIGMLPIAMFLGVDIHVKGPVSTSLAYGIESYQDIVMAWFGKFNKRVRVNYQQLVQRTEEHRPGAVGCSFSGGLDSFYSLYRHLPENQPLKAFQVTHGLIINGFDQVDDPDDEGVARQMFNAYAPVFNSWNIKLLMMTSNLKKFRDIVFAEGGKPFTWGSILIANAHAVGGLFGRYLVSARNTYSWRDLEPHGSHVVLDPTLSSDHLQILSSGAEASRAQKLEALAYVPEVQKNLRVCFDTPKFDEQTGQPVNCGVCEKCARTIVTLDIMEKLESFPAFKGHQPISEYKNPHVLARSKDFFMQDNYLLAKRWRRSDWVQAYTAAGALKRQQEN